MLLPVLLTLSSSVLLESNASILSSDNGDLRSTAAFKGFSFAAKATANTNRGSSDNHSLLNEANLEYTGKVNVGGHGIQPLFPGVSRLSFLADFTLIIDTGSSDLWVTSGQKLKLNSTTNTTVNLTYGIGSAYGNIVYAPVSFGGYQVNNQAFLSVSKAYDQDGEGILGLGFNGLSALERTTKNTSAQSVMANMFTQNPSIPRLIGLALERSKDGEDTAGGYLSIGEYDPRYNNVTYTPRVSVTPTSGSRWTITMDAMTINGNHHTLNSAVKGTKKGQAIALIDSGTSLAYIPSDAVDAIYSQINGSVHVKSANQDAWFVPCLAQVNLSFTFANMAYPINPMELSSPVRVTNQNDQYTVCIGAFRPPLDGTQREFDFLLGDIFMRNVYSVFNFGNGSTTHGDADADAKGASIQFLSRTNRDQVYAGFEGHRKDSLKVYPPLFDLSKLHTDGSTDGGGRLEPPSESS